METTSQKNRYASSRVLKLSILFVAICLLFLLVMVVGGRYVQQRIPEQVKALVMERSQGQYQLEFDKLTFSLLKGELFLEKVRLKPDTIAYRENLTAESANYLIQLDAQELRFSGLNALQYLWKKKININAVHVEKPALVLYQMRDTVKKDTVETRPFERVPDFLKGAKLNRLTVNELSYAKRRIGNLSDSVSTFSGLSFSIDDMELTDSAQQDSTRLWFSKDIQVNSKALKYTLADGMYFFKVEKLHLSTKDRRIDVEAFKVIPMFKELEFSHKLGIQGSRYNVLIPQIHLEGIDFKKWEREGKLVAKSLSMSNGQSLIFTNKKMPARKHRVIQNAPHLALQRLKIPMMLDSLKFENFEVHYRELNSKSNEIGDVFFSTMNGHIANITNDSAALAKNPWMTLQAEMDFLDQAKLKVDIAMNVSSKVGEFTYKGSLGPANAQVYNSILEPLAMVRVEQGKINRLTFAIKANQRGSTGTVQLLYQDLKVSLLVKEDSGKIGKIGLFSFLANKFIIEPDNPVQGLPARIAHFNYVHSPYKTFFGLLWKGVFEGIKGNVTETKEQKHQEKDLLKALKRAEKEKAKEEKNKQP